MGTFDLGLVNRFTEGVIAHGEEILLPTERTPSRRHFSETRQRTTLQVNSAWRDVGSPRGSREGRIVIWFSKRLGQWGSFELSSDSGPWKQARCRSNRGLSFWGQAPVTLDG